MEPVQLIKFTTLGHAYQGQAHILNSTFFLLDYSCFFETIGEFRTIPSYSYSSVNSTKDTRTEYFSHSGYYSSYGPGWQRAVAFTGLYLQVFTSLVATSIVKFVLHMLDC